MPNQTKGVEFVLITPNNGLYFPAVDYLYREVMQLRKEDESYARIPLVINCARLKGLDYTAARGLELISSEIQAKGQRFVVLNASDKMRYVCRKSGCKSLAFCGSLDALSAAILGEPGGFFFFILSFFSIGRSTAGKKPDFVVIVRWSLLSSSRCR